MDFNTVHVSRIFLAWQDEDEENWLREMSKNGLHLKRADLFGSYTFVRGEPREHVYRLDFRNEMKSDLQNYFALFQETGWEYVNTMGGWHYFRKPYNPDEGVEILSDPESKIAKYQRLLWYLLVPLFLMCSSSLNLLNARSEALKIVFIPMFVFIFVFTIVNEVMVYRRIQELKRL